MVLSEPVLAVKNFAEYLFDRVGEACLEWGWDGRDGELHLGNFAAHELERLMGTAMSLGGDVKVLLRQEAGGGVRIFEASVRPSFAFYGLPVYVDCADPWGVKIVCGK